MSKSLLWHKMRRLSIYGHPARSKTKTNRHERTIESLPRLSENMLSLGMEVLLSPTFDGKEMIGHSDLPMTDRYAHLINMRKLARQEDLARLYASSEEMKKSS